MKTLKLTLKKEWFDLINSGEKKEEYREFKQYWHSRLCKNSDTNHLKYKQSQLNDSYGRMSECFMIYQFDYIEFKNGYSKNAPTIICECKSIEIGTGNTRWGALENEQYFVIKLGSITERYNC